MRYFVHFIAGDGLYEGGTIKPDQPAELTLGPFSFVQVTYEFLRVGPDGEHIAAYIPDIGAWQLIEESEFEQEGSVTVAEAPKNSNRPIFSDFSIQAKYVPRETA